MTNEQANERIRVLLFDIQKAKDDITSLWNRGRNIGTEDRDAASNIEYYCEDALSSFKDATHALNASMDSWIMVQSKLVEKQITDNSPAK